MNGFAGKPRHAPCTASPRRTRFALLVCLCVLCDSVAAAPVSAAASRKRPRSVPTPDSRPDRGLYQEAQRALASLKASASRQARRSEWEKVVMAYRRVVARYPQSGYCDNALLAVGDAYREMAKRFKAARYLDDAVTAYKALVAEYPSSSLAEQALFSAFEIARQGPESRRVSDAARAYLEAFPDGPRAPEVKAQTRRRAPAHAASLPQPPPRGLAQVFNLRFWSGESSTRVVLDVEKPVEIRSDRIENPDRLWVDLIGTRLHPNLKDRQFPVGDGLLEQVRIAQNRDDAVRVVLEFKAVRDHSVFYLENPTRLVVDVRGVAPPQVAANEAPAAPTPSPGAAPMPEPPAPTPNPRLAAKAPPSLAPSGPSAEAPEPSPSPRTAAAAPAERVIPSRRLPAVAVPEPPASAPQRARPEIVVEGTGPWPQRPPAPEPQRALRADLRPPTPPQVNRAGSYSLARQLGLGARKIVIDAGHGGHDPGTIGSGGLQEKDLVLDVAARLEKLVKAELGADVVMTRSTDVFVPLEERTAVANARGADLFLSIHANSSRSSRARGIETYFLNFSEDPHAEEVAARENAISSATLKDLQNLVKAITTNTKIDESRDFATSVQEAMVSTLRAQHPQIQDRGVRKAPFYVLIGANMPSVLAEIAFLSNPEEEKLLRKGDHRQRIAQSLLEGVRGYLNALSRNQTRQLTELSAGSTVTTRGQRR